MRAHLEEFERSEWQVRQAGWFCGHFLSGFKRGFLLEVGARGIVAMEENVSEGAIPGELLHIWPSKAK